MMLTRSQLAVVVAAVLVALAAATTTRWTVRIVLGQTPNGFVFERQVQRQGSIFDVSTGSNRQLTQDQQQSLEDQFTTLDPNGDLGVQFDSFEQEDGTNDFVLVLDAETNGTDPMNLFRTIRNVTIMFMNDTVSYDLNTNNTNNDTNTPILVTPRQGDGNDDVPVILGAIFGALGGALLITFIVLYVKRTKEKQKTSAAPTTSPTELETVRSVRVVSRSQAKDVKDGKPQEEPKKDAPASEPVQTFEPQPTAKSSNMTLEDTQHTATTATDNSSSNSDSSPKNDSGNTPEPQAQAQQQRQEEEEQRKPEKEPQPQPQETEDDQPQQSRQGEPEVEEPQPEPQHHKQEEVQVQQRPEEERKLSTPEPGDIAHLRASYRWNAGANAAADPQPGGEVVAPSMERVMDDVHKQQNS